MDAVGLLRRSAGAVPAGAAGDAGVTAVDACGFLDHVITMHERRPVAGTATINKVAFPGGVC